MHCDLDHGVNRIAFCQYHVAATDKDGRGVYSDPTNDRNCIVGCWDSYVVRFLVEDGLAHSWEILVYISEISGSAR